MPAQPSHRSIGSGGIASWYPHQTPHSRASAPTGAPCRTPVKRDGRAGCARPHGGRSPPPSAGNIFWRLDGGVAQTFGVVARHDPLHGREEGLDELLFLVVQVLAYALGDRHR